MTISKPTNPDELYKFFIIGLPREPTIMTWYTTACRRKGWNILTDYDRDHCILPVTYYSNWKRDKPEWILTIRKYI